MNALQRADRHNADRVKLKLIRVGHALWAIMKRDRARNGGYLSQNDPIWEAWATVWKLKKEYRPEFRLDFLVDRLKDEPDMISVMASEHRVELAACVGPRVAESALDAAQTAQAANSLEKMVCHQMAAGHRVAMKLMTNALNDLLPPVEAARLSNAAARMMQVYQEGLLTLHRIRTGGRQTVVVQHVQVSDGGQAVVAGNVNADRTRVPVGGI